jgi:hypothetical protein
LKKDGLLNTKIMYRDVSYRILESVFRTVVNIKNVN